MHCIVPCWTLRSSLSACSLPNTSSESKEGLGFGKMSLLARRLFKRTCSRTFGAAGGVYVHFKHPETRLPSSGNPFRGADRQSFDPERRRRRDLAHCSMVRWEGNCKGLRPGWTVRTRRTMPSRPKARAARRRRSSPRAYLTRRHNSAAGTSSLEVEHKCKVAFLPENSIVKLDRNCDRHFGPFPLVPTDIEKHAAVSHDRDAHAVLMAAIEIDRKEKKAVRKERHTPIPRDQREALLRFVQQDR
jgi:hypothetical protein